MRNFKKHLLVLFGLQALVMVVYYHVLSQPLWSSTDFEILADAIRLNHDPASLLRHVGTLFSQPILQLGFLVEFRVFGLDPCGYLIVNLILHAFNSFVLYLLVNMLFHRGKIALPASVLFALSVGHYGKVLLSIAGLESLLLGFFYLLGLYALIRSDFKHGGRLGSPWYLLGLLLFGLAGLTKPAMFSILLCLLAYKFFFFKERGGRAVFPPSFLILIVVGILFAVFRELWGFKEPPLHFSGNESVISSFWLAIKTVFRYLNLMVFPMQVSSLLQSSNPAIRFIYEWRVIIRTMVSLSIISFSFFGIIFGSRPLRFFIAWTFITVLPFSLTQNTGGWLNLQYLYLSSAGFCVILSAGATGFSGLLKSHPRKRWVPWIIPALFIAMTLLLNVSLVEKNKAVARTRNVRDNMLVLQRIIAPREPASDSSH